MKSLVVIEKTPTGHSAYSPDLPGCVSTGSTPREVQQNRQRAAEFPLDGLREEGYPIPQPISASAYIQVAEAA